MDAPWADGFPALLEPLTWGEVRCRFAFGIPPPPLTSISNVSLVPFVGADLLLIRLADGLWEIPGGTREPDELPLETVRRELLEEAGACLLDFAPLGAWRCRSTAPQPYRPHLPHPDFCRLVGYGAVALVDVPLHLAGAEDVVEVACVPVAEAADRFRSVGRPDLADLYRLAAAVRAGQIAVPRTPPEE